MYKMFSNAAAPVFDETPIPAAVYDETPNTKSLGVKRTDG
jgi:hypothetical protein